MAVDPWLWLMLGFSLLILELAVSSLFFLWLSVAALITGGVLFLYPTMGWEIQLLLFSILSVVSLVLSRRYVSRKQIASDLPALNRRGQQYVGRIFTLIEPIANGYGKVAVDDTQWRVSGPPLEVGARVRVIAAHGAVLEVEAVSSN